MGEHVGSSERLPFIIYRSTFKYKSALLEHGFLITDRAYHGLIVDWLGYFVRKLFKGSCLLTRSISLALLLEEKILTRLHGAICSGACFYAALESNPHTDFRHK
jgi:hypothetical protein